MDVDDIDTIAVLGAGNMGHGIAEVAAIAGFNVALRDINEDLVQDGYENIEWSLEKLVEHDQLTVDVDEILDRISPVVELEDAVGDADVVIEAVPEQMEIKRDVYEAVEAHAPKHTVFASNTSSLSITELSEATDRPEKVCGMHFFNPPVRMELVEVIQGAHTAESTLSLIEDLATAMGKTPVRVHKDSPGFIVNRVLVPLLNEAAWITHSEAASRAEVDSTTKYDMGLPMGAFELADQVGIDVTLDVLEYMHDTLGAAYTPCPLLIEKVDADQVGKKAGQGFYDYEDGGVEIPADAGRESIQMRLVAVMANEVAKLVGNDVAEPAAIDEASQLGAGFPTGPAAMADAAGLDQLYDTLTELEGETGAERYAPAQVLREYAEQNRGFYNEETTTSADDFQVLNVERNGAVGRIELDRPHRMNSINPDVIAELDRAIDQFEADDRVGAILLTGAGDRAFSAGADVQGVISNVNPVEAVELSREGQRVFGRLDDGELPTVAVIDGFCLGGGMELATACDLRVASDRSEFGQPEHTLGLMPGWGATQRLQRIVGEGRAKEIIFTGDRYPAETMEDYGFLTEVVAADALEETAVEVAEQLAAGPPIAQQYTKRAMARGRDDMAAGLEIEAEAFGVLASTDDLTEGITAFSEDRDPEFTGE